MNLEKYTERARGFIQSAQQLALRENHQQFTPEHVLKVLLDDEQGLCAGLIDKAGGRSKEALAQVEAALKKMPKVQGAGAGQLYLAPTTARLFDNAEKLAEKAGDSFVTVERLLVALALEKGAEAAKIIANAGVDAADAQRRDQRHPQGPHRRQRGRREPVRRAEEIYARPHRGRQDRQARPRHRPRRGNPPHHAGAEPPHQEQSRADRRARRRQDRHRRGSVRCASSTATCRSRIATRSCCRSTWAR